MRPASNRPPSPSRLIAARTVALLLVAAASGCMPALAAELGCSFQEIRENPILCPVPGSWEGGSVAEPQVLFDGQQFLMWYQGSQTGGEKGQIGVAMSLDGVLWTRAGLEPVVRNDAAWKDAGVGNGLSVIYDAEERLFKMWYVGLSSLGEFGIGLATSVDGLLWNDYEGNPVLRNGADGSWNRRLAWPSVIKEGGAYRMWLYGTSADVGAVPAGIGHLTSTDGFDWIVPENPLPSLSLPAVQVSDPHVVPDAGQYHVFVNRGPQIVHGTSPNGLDWNLDIDPALTPGAPGSWDSDNVRNASVPAVGAAVQMWFAGSATGFDACIGLATCSACATDVDCDDGVFCNGSETCDPATGLCQAGKPVTCDDENPCTDDACDPLEDLCVNRPLPDGTACADGDACNGAETCQNGACQAGDPIVCDDNNPCTKESCDPVSGACNVELLPDGASCSDGQACNGEEVCMVGACAPGEPPSCDDGNPCTDDACDPQTNSCINRPLPDGTACGDGDACNGAETCQNGTCQAGDPVVCDDNNPCTRESCDPMSGACNVELLPDGTSCSDGQLCNGEEVCTAGACAPGAPPSCDDGNPCTDDACDPQANACVVTILPDGTSCADGRFCNGDEVCGQGLCQPGTPVACDDGNPCTADACSELLRRCVAAVLDSERAIGADRVCTTVDDNLTLYGADGRCASLDDGRGDGVCDAMDNCPLIDNADQADADGDGSGDACDPIPCPQDSLVMAVPDGVVGVPGSSVTIPVRLGDTTDQGVLSADLTLRFNPLVLNATAVALGGLTSGCSMVRNLSTPGTAVISVFCATPLTGSGALLEIDFDITGGRGQGTPILITAATLNEGDPAVCLDRGSFQVPGTLDILGQVLYFRESLPIAEPSAKPVNGAKMSLSGAASASLATGCDGAYAFNGLAPDQDYATGAGKAGDAGLSISPLDASVNARHVVNLITLTPNQQIAADVSGNGTLSAFDSALIAQFSVGLISQFPVAAANASDWAFVPVPQVEPNQTIVTPIPSAGVAGSIAYTPLVETAEAQDYLAVLYGDVTGNWRPNCEVPLASGSLVIASSTLDGRDPRTTLRTGGRLLVASSSARPGDLVRVPIRSAGLQEALSFYFEVGFDARVLRLAHVEAGAAASGFTATTNRVEPGRIRVALFSAAPLTADGTIAVATFEVIGGAGDRSAVTLSGVSVDEGAIATGARDGSVRVRRRR